MAIFVQHGYGKGTKIEQAILGNSISGIILSPKDEMPANLEGYVNSIRDTYPQIEVLFDPQFYATTIYPVRDGRLPEYPYYRPNLDRRSFIQQSDILDYVRSTIDYQANMHLSFIISPCVYFNDFQDPWSQIALSMAQTTSQYHSAGEIEPPLLLSLVFSENALGNTDSLSEYLDIISLFNSQGFYIVIKRENAQYQTQMNPDYLGNLLYFIYVLAEVNNFEVYIGYADLIGMLLHAVGASATACGWHNSLRQFTLDRFLPSTGGRPARDRYTSTPLLNSILVQPELVEIHRAGFMEQVASNTSYDGNIRRDPGNAPWTQEISTLHHWEALNDIVQPILRCTRTEERLTLVLQMIDNARSIYEEIYAAKIPLETYSGNEHLEQWERAIDNFCGLVGITI